MSGRIRVGRFAEARLPIDGLALAEALEKAAGDPWASGRAIARAIGDALPGIDTLELAERLERGYGDAEAMARAIGDAVHSVGIEEARASRSASSARRHRADNRRPCSNA